MKELKVQCPICVADGLAVELVPCLGQEKRDKADDERRKQQAAEAEAEVRVLLTGVPVRFLCSCSLLQKRLREAEEAAAKACSTGDVCMPLNCSHSPTRRKKHRRLPRPHCWVCYTSGATCTWYSFVAEEIAGRASRG